MGIVFFIGKLAWSILAPSWLLIWLGLATAAALWLRRERVARWLAVAMAADFLVFGILPTGVWLTRGLENTYAAPNPPPAHVDGILVLGDGLGERIVRSRQTPDTNAFEGRLITTMALTRQYPSARVLFSGGWPPVSDAAAARFLFAQMGLDDKRLTLERQSHDTYENLVFSLPLAAPKPAETWVLATSAIQMPRAMAVARRIGWKLTPWPTDYLTTPRNHFQLLDLLEIGAHFRLADQSLHELLGLVVYRLRGRAA